MTVKLLPLVCRMPYLLLFPEQAVHNSAHIDLPANLDTEALDCLLTCPKAELFAFPVLLHSRLLPSSPSLPLLP